MYTPASRAAWRTVLPAVVSIGRPSRTKDTFSATTISLRSSSLLRHQDSVLVADIAARSAPDALLLVDHVRGLPLARDALCGAAFETQPATRALLFVDDERCERLAYPGLPPPAPDMRLVFVPEVPERAQRGVRRRLAQPAQG